MLYRNNRRMASLQYKLGLISHHAIYRGEATSILLTTKLIAKEVLVHSVIIYVNSRALILALLPTAPTPGHYLIDAVHAAISNIHKRSPRLSIPQTQIPLTLNSPNYY